MASWVYRRVPVNLYDAARMESWLEGLSEQGLELAGIAGPVGLFRRVEARRRKCHMEPADMFSEERLEEQLTPYIRCGWEAVADIGGVFYVFMSTVPEPVEIHTDPASQAFTYRNIRQKVRHAGIEALGIVLLVLMVSRPYFKTWGLFGGMLNGPVIGWLMLMAVAVLLLAICLSNWYYLARTHRRLKRGVPIARRTDWRRRGRLNLGLQILLVLLLAGGLILNPFRGESKTTKNYEEVAAILPVLELADLEGPDFVYTGRETASGMTIDNAVYYVWALLAPERYDVVQMGDSPAGGQAQLRVEYCRAVWEWLAAGYYRELAAKYEAELGVPEALPPEGFDEGLIWADGEGTRVLLRKGSVVVDYDYEGQQDLAVWAGAAAERIR